MIIKKMSKVIVDMSDIRLEEKQQTITKKFIITSIKIIDI